MAGLSGIMKTTNHQSILIVEPNEQLREEMVNFLLSAGYENAEATESLAAACLTNSDGNRNRAVRLKAVWRSRRDKSSRRRSAQPTG
jgi:hypothetical protein